MREPFNSLLERDLTLETLVSIMQELENEFKLANADMLDPKRKNSEDLKLKFSELSESLTVLRACKKELLKINYPISLRELCLIILHSKETPEAVKLAAAKLIKEMFADSKEMFANLITVCLAQNDNPLSLINLMNDLTYFQLIALIAAFLDNENVAKSDLLNSRIFNTLLEIHCGMDNNDTKAAHELINILTNNKHKEFIDSLANISAEIDESVIVEHDIINRQRLANMTLAGEGAREVQHKLQRFRVPPLNLTKEKWQILYAILGDVALSFASIYTVLSKEELQQIISTLSFDSLLKICKYSHDQNPEAMAYFMQIFWKNLNHEQRIFLQNKSSESFFWHVLTMLDSFTYNEVLQSCDLEKLSPINIGIHKTIKLIEDTNNLEIKNKLSVLFFKNLFTTQKFATDEFYEFNSNIYSILKNNPAVVRVAEAELIALEENIIKIIKEEPFSWRKVDSEMNKVQAQANFLNHIVSSQDVSLLGHDAYSKNAFVISELLKHKNISTVQEFAEFLFSISEYHDEEYRKRMVLRYIVYATTEELEKNFPVIQEYLKSVHGIEDLGSQNVDGVVLKEYLLRHPFVFAAYFLDSEHEEQYSLLVKVAREKPAALKKIFAHLPLEKRLELLNTNYVNGNFMHFLLDKPILLKQIFELIPAECRLSLLLAKDQSNKNVFQQINMTIDNTAQVWESVKYLLELFPENMRSKVIEAQDDEGNKLLHKLVESAEGIKYILELYPEPLRLKVVQEKNNLGESLVYLAKYKLLPLKQILELLPAEKRLQALRTKDRSGKTILHTYHLFMDDKHFTEILSLLPAKDRAQALLLKSDKGEPVLFRAIEDLDFISALMSLFSLEEMLNILLEAKNKQGENLLHEIMHWHNSGVLNTTLPKDVWLKLARARDNKSQTLLHKAALYSKSNDFNRILDYYPREERLNEVRKKDNSGQNVLHLAAATSDSAKDILYLYNDGDRVKALQEKDSSGRSVLQLAAANKSYVDLQDLLDFFQGKALKVVQEKNNQGQTLLHLATVNHTSLKRILELYNTKDEKLNALNNKDKCGQTVIHLAAANFDSLKLILDLYSDYEAQLLAILQKDNSGQTALFKVNGDSRALKLMLDLLPEKDKAKIIQEKDNAGKTIFHKAVEYSSSSFDILRLLPPKARLQLMLEKDNSGQMALHGAAKTSTLPELMALLPKEDILRVLQEKDKNGQTPLHIFAANRQELLRLLEFYPADLRKAALLEKDNSGANVLHHVANSTYLSTVLTTFFREDIPKILQEKDNFGQTVLHFATKDQFAFKYLLAFYADDRKKLQALQEKTSLGQTALHLAAESPEVLIQILNLYPKEDRLNAMLLKDNSGKSALQLAAKDKDKLKQICRFLFTESAMQVAQDSCDDLPLITNFKILLDAFDKYSLNLASNHILEDVNSLKEDLKLQLLVYTYTKNTQFFQESCNACIMRAKAGAQDSVANFLTSFNKLLVKVFTESDISETSGCLAFFSKTLDRATLMQKIDKVFTKKYPSMTEHAVAFKL